MGMPRDPGLKEIYRKEQLAKMQVLAHEKGGICLSIAFVNSHERLNWQCAKGHRWSTLPDVIKRGGWCSSCLGRAKLTLPEMQSLALSKGGRCLSKEYINAHSLLKWSCDKGHEWMASPTSVKSRSWCPHCAKRFPLTLKSMQSLAVRKGGKCLSIVYKAAKQKLLWECENKHQWLATPDAVKNRGTWCAACAGLTKLTIEEMRALAKARGGKCLSKKYENNGSKLLWECAKGHQWEAEPKLVKRQKTWCTVCAQDRRRTKIERAHLVAKARGGQCLSASIKTQSCVLRWKCIKGHEWEARAGMVIRGGTWCPDCLHKGESAARDAMQKALGVNFDKKRPRWLKREKGRPLELDGYAEEIGMAFEYQGEQHYAHVDHFHNGANRTTFQEQQEKDEFRRKACIDKGVLLIEIEQVNVPTAERVESAVLHACKQACASPLASALFKSLIEKAYGRMDRKFYSFSPKPAAMSCLKGRRRAFQTSKPVKKAGV